MNTTSSLKTSFVDLKISSDLQITQDLIVDENTFVVDSDNSRVGVGILTPAHKLDVAGDMNI